MKRFRTIASVIIMVASGIPGFFVGVAFQDALGGSMLFSITAGIACIIYAIDNHER